jgi:hypothetical protein
MRREDVKGRGMGLEMREECFGSGGRESGRGNLTVFRVHVYSAKGYD